MRAALILSLTVLLASCCQAEEAGLQEHKDTSVKPKLESPEELSRDDVEELYAPSDHSEDDEADDAAEDGDDDKRVVDSVEDDANDEAEASLVRAKRSWRRTRIGSRTGHSRSHKRHLH